MSTVIKTTLVFFLFLSFQSFSQNEQKGFAFQGYARNSTGGALTSQNVEVVFEVIPDGVTAAEYSETQNLKTDVYGVFNTTIGSIAPASFAKLRFDQKKYTLKVNVNGVTVSNAELKSVPYAKAADNGVPAGTILPFAGTNPPLGYLICDGSAKLKSEYPGLFSAIGTAWGDGSTNGSGDFNLPELRGMFLRGTSGPSAGDPEKGARTAINTGGNTGNNVGTLQNSTTALPVVPFQTNTSGNHNHSYNDNTFAGQDNTWRGGGSASGPYTGVNTSSDKNTNTTGNHQHTVATGGDAETRPKNAAVLYIIKY